MYKRAIVGMPYATEQSDARESPKSVHLRLSHTDGHAVTTIPV